MQLASLAHHIARTLMDRFHIARKRLQIVTQRTQNILSLQSLITRLTSITHSGSDLKKMKTSTLRKLIGDEHYFIIARTNLRLIQKLNKEEKEIEEILLNKIKLNKVHHKLLQIPGVGKKLAITIMLETGDIERFLSTGNYASYCRCVGSKRESNGKKKGKITERMATNIYLGLS